MPDNDQYKVVISQNEFNKLKDWGEWAKQAGCLDEYLVALKTINYRLTYEPLDWGEPRYSLNKLGLEVRLGTFKMLNVWFGVNASERTVYVKVFQLRGDFPHDRPPETE